jgi:hypothetical protein
MNSSNLLNIINSEKALKELSLDQLKKLSDDFPYFQSAKSLYLKRLFQLEDYHFNSFLKITAAYSGDRSVLFDYITSSNEVEDIETKESADQSPDLNDAPSDFIPEVIETKESADQSQVIEDGHKEDNQDDVHRIIKFKADDKYSFLEWLKLSDQNQSNTESEEENNTETNQNNSENSAEQSANQNIIENKKDLLVEKFISSSPSLKPKKNEGPKGNIARQSTEENVGWMTETLAQVYVEQKKYSKAIKAYKILGLKYPEKSGFFADRIRSIERLM